MYYNTRIWLLSLIDSSFCIKTDRSHKLLETGWWRNILSWLCLQSLTLRTYINLMVDTKRIFFGGKMKDFIQQVRILVYYTQSFAKLVSSIIQDLRLDIGSFVTFCWGTL